MGWVGEFKKGAEWKKVGKQTFYKGECIFEKGVDATIFALFVL